MLQTAFNGLISGVIMTLPALAVTLLFVTGLHQVLIAGVVDSYTAMPPGGASACRRAAILTPLP